MGKRKLVVPEARDALEQFKIEMAKEFGLNESKFADFGYLSSYHTGKITKKLVEIGTEQLLKH